MHNNESIEEQLNSKLFYRKVFALKQLKTHKNHTEKSVALVGRGSIKITNKTRPYFVLCM